ncbi:unnamed protein product [Allacma fusca]|uniref:CobQ/CobB/MinD/ParA nucleotide binding domain-containing protein n=1 Tax=Allacma fusca TaxID=39272 RepID=A0A8J2L8N1_9HEXA|nr:unnamed protein product [Allacma fusca]
MIFTIGHTKGGVGKTVVTVNLAAALALQGKSVYLVDGDRQASSFYAMQARRQEEIDPTIDYDNEPDGKKLAALVESKAKNYDHVLIDVGGRDSSALRAALVVSDLLLIPFAPRSLDVWAMADIDELINEARKINPKLKAKAVINGADAVGNDNKAALDVVAQYPNIEYLDAPIGRRKSFASSIGYGQSVLEHKPKDRKAIAEVTRLLNIVFA